MDELFATTTPPHQAELLAISEELGIGPHCVAVCGSTLICGEGNDLDVLALMPEHKIHKLEAYGYVAQLDDAHAYEGSPFTSYRKGAVNLLATSDRSFYLTELTVAHAAAYVHAAEGMFVSRAARVDFHTAIRDTLSLYRAGTE